jgi:hypothetical protein
MEAAAEIALRGRVGNPRRAQGVQKHLVVAAQFDVFQPHARAHRIVGQVQHVIRLVIGQMDLQHLHAAVDRLDQAALAGQFVNRADAPHAHAADLLRDFLADVLRREHRLGIPAATLAVQPLLDPLLGGGQLFGYRGIHSKSSLRFGLVNRTMPIKPEKQGGFEAIFVFCEKSMLD